MSTPSPLPAVRVRVPASSANLGPGFDSIGVALGLWDEYTISLREQPGIVIEVTGEAADEVPRDGTHLVLRSLASGYAQLGTATPWGLTMSARNGIPHGRGLGSSASAIVAGVVAAHALSAIATNPEIAVGSAVPIDLARVTDLSSELEGHPDNASASVYGGMTLSWTVDPGQVDQGRIGTAHIDLHPQVTAVAFVPGEQLATHHARSVLPETVSHRDAALNSARAALLIEAVTRRPDLLLPATRDWLHQEARRSSFPASMDLVDALRAAGHAALISGAGPSVLVLTTGERSARVQVPTAAEGRLWERLEPGIPAHGVSVTRQ